VSGDVGSIGDALIEGTLTYGLKDGSPSNLAFNFDGDEDTGLFHPPGDSNSNVIALATGGVERLRIEGDGNVGIGTSTPIATLHVDGDLHVSGNADISNIYTKTEVDGFLDDKADTGQDENFNNLTANGLFTINNGESSGADGQRLIEANASPNNNLIRYEMRHQDTATATSQNSPTSRSGAR
jgi:hypothetical protein